MLNNVVGFRYFDSFQNVDGAELFVAHFQIGV